MKLIEAFIPPDSLDQVRNLLSQQGLEELVASETSLEPLGDGDSRWQTCAGEFVPQVKLEVAVSDDRAIATAHQIFDMVSNSDPAGAVQILIGRLDQVVRIETGERGPAAL